MKATVRTELTFPRTEEFASPIQWSLRIGVFLCFLGHGSYALMAKPEWAAFFGVVGIPSGVGLQVMPWVGLLDLTVASFALASPRPIVLLWAAFWCLWTATLRPLTGLGIWEFWARAGNFGLPIAFLALRPWPRSLREWVAPISSGRMVEERLRVAGFILRASIVLYLMGHAVPALFQGRDALLGLFTKAGLPSMIGGVALPAAVGWFEVGLAAGVLMKPARSLLLLVSATEIASGLLQPASGAYWWDFIEHGADYLAPIALIFIGKALAARARLPNAPPAPTPLGATPAAPAPVGAPPPPPATVAPAVALGAMESNPSA